MPFQPLHAAVFSRGNPLPELIQVGRAVRLHKTNGHESKSLGLSGNVFDDGAAIGGRVLVGVCFGHGQLPREGDHTPVTVQANFKEVYFVPGQSQIKGCQALPARGGYQNGLLKLGGKRPVHRDSGPVVRKDAQMPLP